MNRERNGESDVPSGREFHSKLTPMGVRGGRFLNQFSRPDILSQAGWNPLSLAGQARETKRIVTPRLFGLDETTRDR